MPVRWGYRERMGSAQAEPMPRSRGRRPGGVDTRAVILDAARAEFAAKGYDGTSLRGIARAAEVDPALVHHYFDGKPALFAEMLGAPINPAVLFEQIFSGDRETLGWRVIETFLRVWDPPESRDGLVALFRSSMTSDDAARLLREFLGREVFSRIAAATGAPDAQLRGTLAASQVFGLVVLRYVLQVPALVEASNEEIVARLGPVLQQHLVDTPRPRE
ncbi:TetR family transcriptional regulator [Intrasporangium mesophilum]